MDGFDKLMALQDMFATQREPNPEEQEAAAERVKGAAREKVEEWQRGQ